MRGTKRILLVLAAATASAQTSLADLEQKALKAQSEWFRVATDLDLRLARMLPCAPTVAAAIDEVHRASTARLVAWADYTKLAVEMAQKDVATARDLQRAFSEYLTGSANERADTEQERAGVESQLTNLAESVRRKIALTVASDGLRAIDAMVRERATQAAQHVTANEASRAQITALVTALEKREAALRKHVAALEDERLKWNGFYAARLARSRVECSVTGTGR